MLYASGRESEENSPSAPNNPPFQTDSVATRPIGSPPVGRFRIWRRPPAALGLDDHLAYGSTRRERCEGSTGFGEGIPLLNQWREAALIV